MDTNFTLNLVLVSILLIIYFFSESDFKSENFENVDSESNESNKVKNKIEQLSAVYNKKPTLNAEVKIKKLQKETEKALREASKEAEADLKKIQPPKNKSKKKKDKNSIIRDSNYYTKKLNKKNEFTNTNEIINSESINSRENNPAKNLPIPQNLNTTYYGLFNKHNLPPSSRPNVIDIFESTPSKGNETTQQNIGGEGNIFIPKLYMS